MISAETIQAARNLRLHMLSDPYRPAFHFVVPEDYAKPADPNGAVFWNGRYHLGYIYQDNGVHFWGHVSSLDMVHWRHHPPCLFPTPDSPEEGIFSGNCFINKAGQATMLYHGVKVGNSIATSDDAQLDTWHKLPGNPIARTSGVNRPSFPMHPGILTDGLRATPTTRFSAAFVLRYSRPRTSTSGNTWVTCLRTAYPASACERMSRARTSSSSATSGY